MSEPDHIIVGSGINALVCAALLAGKGGKVLVLERNDRIGGCIRTEEITAPGFIHDVMATTFVLFITSPAYAALGADLGRHGLEFCHTDDADRRAAARRQPRRAAAWTAPPISPPSMRSRPATATSYGSDVGEIERNAGLLFGLLGGGAVDAIRRSSCWPAKPGGAGRAALPPFSARRWRRRAAGWKAPTSPRPSRALWAPWVLHAGLGPEDAFSGQIAKVIAFALEAAGAPIVKGGAKNLLAAFEALIRERGGEIRTGADVASIVQADGRATGVRLASGEEIVGDEERHLLGHADAALRAAARRRDAPASDRRRGARNTATARAISRSTMRWTGRRHGAAKGSARSRCCI